MQMTGRSLENTASSRKGSGDISASCVHILPAAVIGFSAAPARSKINRVTSCPAIQEVQPHHQRYNIPSNNKVFRWCNGKREKIRRGDKRDDMN